MALSKIMQKVAAFKRKAASHTINEQEFKFYPVRLSRLLTGEIKEATAPLAKAMTVLMTCGENLKAEKHTQVEGMESEIPGGVYTKESELSVQALDWLNSTRGNAVEKALREIIDPKTSLIVGRVLADSLRDEFDRDVSDEEIQEFMHELDVRDLAEFIIGFLKVNAEVFGFDATNREKVGNVIRDFLQKMKGSEDLAPALQVVPKESNDEEPK